MDQRKLENLVDVLLSYGKETEWIEYKENIPNNSHDKIGQLISGLSNTSNLFDKNFGYIVFGIQDNSLEIVGTQFSIDGFKVGSEDLEHWLIQRLNPKIDFRIYEFLYKGKFPIVIFEIPKALDRPIEFVNESFVRINSITRRLGDFPEKEKKIRKNLNNLAFENQVAKSGLTSEEVVQLLDYPSYFRLMKEPLPEGRIGILNKFIQEGFICKSNSDRYDVTNLGAILFANSLKDFFTTKRKGIRVVTYKGKNRLDTIREQEGGKGYAGGFQNLIKYVAEQSPSQEIIKNGLRIKIAIPELIIREIIANAIIHQDFSQTGTGPMIEVFIDRIEVTNPGVPVIDIQRLLDHPPKSRNEDLASFMRRVNICEERGSGIDKVIIECEHNNLQAPDFESGDSYTKVVIYQKSILSRMSELEKIRTVYRHSCLKYVNKDFMTNESIRKRFNIDEKNYSLASRLIAKCMEKGIIKFYDSDNKSKKYTKYVPYWVS